MHKTYGTKGCGKKAHRAWDVEHGARKDQGPFAR